MRDAIKAHFDGFGRIDLRHAALSQMRDGAELLLLRFIKRCCPNTGRGVVEEFDAVETFTGGPAYPSPRCCGPSAAACARAAA